MSRPGVLLDRDGCVSREKGYINHADRFELYSGNAKAIRRLNDLGVPVALVTNQSGVARGYFPHEVVEKGHARIRELLKAEGGAWLDGIYVCPHHPDGIVEPFNITCNCRKPGTGLADSAAAELNLDLSASYIVGDKDSDIKLAHAVGAKGVLVKTGYGRGILKYYPEHFIKQPDCIAENLVEAIDWIISQMEQG